MSPLAGQRHELQLIFPKGVETKKGAIFVCLSSLNCLLKHLVLPNKDQIIKGDLMESIHSRSEASRPIIKSPGDDVSFGIALIWEEKGKSRWIV